MVAGIEIQKKQFKIRVNLKKGMLKDPQAMFRDMSEAGHLGLGDYEAVVNADTDLDYLIGMVKHGYRYHT